MRIAITREVGASLADCQLTHLERQPIDVALARQQHARYRARLAEMGLEVVTLPAAAELPDAVFVEDPALVLDALAILSAMKVDKNGILRHVPPGENADPKRGARIGRGSIQLGLEEKEIDAIEKRLRKLLERVDAGKLATF